MSPTWTRRRGFRLAGLACALTLQAWTANVTAADPARPAFVERFRAAAAQPDPAALADLTALPFLYEGQRIERARFMRDAVPALFTPGVRRCLQRTAAKQDSDRLVLWCPPYGFHLGQVQGQWRLVEFVADVD
jgi:hypothetical protein